MYNASLVENYTLALEFENLNHVWVKFTADGSYDESHVFVASVGLRAYERDDDDDEEETTTVEEDEDKKVAKYPVVVIPISR